MKRFGLIASSDGDRVMADKETGAWVRYEDAADIQRQLAEVTAERDLLRAMLEVQNAKLERVAAVIERSGK